MTWELQAGQPPFDPRNGNEANHPGNHFHPGNHYVHFICERHTHTQIYIYIIHVCVDIYIYKVKKNCFKPVWGQGAGLRELEIKFNMRRKKKEKENSGGLTVFWFVH